MCDCEMPTVFEQVTRTARKKHVCCECRNPILPGQRYVYSSGLWDGHFDHFSQHESCADFARYMQLSGKFCECLPFGGIQQEICEARDPEYGLAWWLLKNSHRPAKGAVNR